MSIATEITRLQNAKAALKTSINAKTDSQHQITNQTLDSYASFVDSISGGGEVEKFLVKVIDYDGTVLKSEELAAGSTFTLPSNPSHSGLVFQTWSTPLTITNNKITVPEGDIVIGAVYRTSSNQSEFNIELTSLTGLSVTLNLDGTKNWGDGVTNTSTTHTYSSYGSYTIKCNGTVMSTTYSSTAANSIGLFGQNNPNPNSYCVEARLTNITQITDYAFGACSCLKNIIISNSLTTISQYAFSGASYLQTTILPPSLTSIALRGFSGCRGMGNLVIPNSSITFGTNCFASCSALKTLVVPGTITTIPGSFCVDCFGLNSLTILNGVEEIGIQGSSGCFNRCYGLRKLKLPSSITYISANSFKDCSSLIEIEIEGNDFSGNNDVFTNCRALNKVVIKSGVTKILNSMFSNCNGLKEISIPNTVTQFAVGYNFSNCWALETINLPNQLSSLLSNTFNQCYNLNNIIIPSSVQNIADSCFNSCFNLKNITINEGVRTIGNNIFSQCYSLRQIKVPKTVTSIGTYFCTGVPMELIDFSDFTSIPTITTSTFTNLNKHCKIAVPDSLYNSWKTETNWVNFADYIYKASEVL